MLFYLIKRVMIGKRNPWRNPTNRCSGPPNVTRMYLVYIECIIPAGYTACWAAAELHVGVCQLRRLDSSVAPFFVFIVSRCYKTVFLSYECTKYCVSPYNAIFSVNIQEIKVVLFPIDRLYRNFSKHIFSDLADEYGIIVICYFVRYCITSLE